MGSITEPKKRARPTILFRTDRLAGACCVNRITIRTLQTISLGLCRKRFIILLKPSNDNGSALLGVLNKLSIPSDKTMCFGRRGLATKNSHLLAQFQHRSVNFVFRFCGLVPDLATQRGITLIASVTPRPLQPRITLRLINLNSHLSRFPSRLSNKRRRQITVTHTVTGQPRILFYSRPAKTLSFDAKGQILRILTGIGRRVNAAIIIVARGTKVKTVNSHVVAVHSNRVRDVITGTQQTAPSRLR